MRKIFRYFLVPLILILIICLTLILFRVFNLPPALIVKQYPNSAMVDLRTLGEYPAKVSRIQIIDSAMKKIVWEALARDDVSAIWTFSLSCGSNPVLIDDSFKGRFEIIIPDSNKSFNLAPNRRYEIKVIGADKKFSKAFFSFTEQINFMFVIIQLFFQYFINLADGK